MKNLIEKLTLRPWPETVGLDLGGGAVKLVRLLPAGAGLKLSGFARVEISPSDNPDERRLNTVKAVKQALRESGPGDKTVCLVLSGEKVVVRRLVLPVMPVRELAKAVGWEIKNYLPADPDWYYWDFRILTEFIDAKGVRHLALLTAAAEKEFVEEKIGIVEEAGVAPRKVGIVAEALAGFVALVPRSAEDGSFAVVDIGFNRTDVVIFKGKTLRFSRELSIGGRNVTGAMTGAVTVGDRKIELNPALAEEIKRKYGIPGLDARGTTEQGIPLNAILPMLRPEIERLASEVRRSLDYYTGELCPGEQITQVFLSGGGAQLKNLAGFLAEELRMAVKKVSVPPGIQYQGKASAGEDFKQSFCELATALGAAAGRGGKINLLPPRQRMAKLEKLEKSCLRMGAFVLGLILLLVWGWSRGKIYALEKQLSQVRAHYKHLSQAQALKGRWEELRRFSQQMTGSQARVSGIMKELSNLTPSPVVLTEFFLSRQEKELKLKGVVFAGDEAAEAVLVRFIGRLEGSPFFARARLISAQKNGKYETEAADFELLAELVIGE